MKPISVKTISEAAGGSLRAVCRGNDKKGEHTKITSVCTNSREVKQGSLFVAIAGEKADGHKFIGQALKTGAAAVLTTQGEEAEEGFYIKVSDTRRALQKAAAFYRSQFKLPLIGITGSVGKTTTKEMVYTALSAGEADTAKKVLKTAGNMNSQIGLPLMMFELEESFDLAVIEMGMSEAGEMERLSQVARPEAAIMTNIGVSHIGQLKTQENIRKEKLAIIHSFPDGGILCVNGDDPLLLEVKKFQDMLLMGQEKELEGLLYPKTMERLKKIKVVTFGLAENCDYRAWETVLEGMGSHFTFISPKARQKVTLSVPGLHNVQNAIAALFMAEQYGISLDVAAAALSLYQPIAMRGGFVVKNGVTLIDDTYNASPDSMKSGIDVLLSAESKGKRYAVLADILELGEASRKCHYEVGGFLASRQNEGRKTDVLVTVGTEAEAIADGARAFGREDLEVYSFQENKEALEFLKQKAAPGDILLVKGSRGMHMDEIVAAF